MARYKKLFNLVCFMNDRVALARAAPSPAAIRHSEGRKQRLWALLWTITTNRGAARRAVRDNSQRATRCNLVFISLALNASLSFTSMSDRMTPRQEWNSLPRGTFPRIATSQSRPRTRGWSGGRAYQVLVSTTSPAPKSNCTR